MAMLAFVVGAVLGIALVSRLLIWALGAWKVQSIARLLLAHVLTYLIAAIGSAYGNANGGPPLWEFGFGAYALPALLVTLLDVVNMVRRRRKGDSPAAGRNVGGDPIWFIHVNSQQRGPLTTEAVRASLAQGTVRREDWIWRDGLESWVQIANVDQFAGTSSVDAGRARSSSYILRHWRGELSLVRSYWVNTLALTVLFGALFAALMLVEFADYPRLISVVMICAWPFSVIAQTWLSVGIWRSARHYSETHPRRYWGGVARLLTTIGWISTLSGFVIQGLPQMGGFMAVISETNQTRYALRALRSDTEMEVTGPLDFGLAEEVEQFLVQHPTVKTVHLHSPGGRLAEADKLSKLILRRSLNTYVSSSCRSACVTVFAAGKERWLSREAVLGLHEPHFPGAEAADLKAMSAATQAFLIARGVDAGFVTRGLSVPHESIWEPSHDELFRSGLATAYATDQNVAVSGGPIGNIAEVEKGLTKIALYQVLREKHAEEFGKILEIHFTGYQKGQSIAELRSRTWAVIFPLIEKSLPSASDEALLTFYHVAADEVEAFSRISAQSCEALLKGNSQGFDFSLLPAELQQRDLDASAELLRTKGSYISGKVDERKLENVFAMIIADASAAGFASDEFYRGLNFQLDASKNCKAMQIFFRSILAIGTADRALALRYIAQQSAVQ